jgi:hypothetical protein
MDMRNKPEQLAEVTGLLRTDVPGMQETRGRYLSAEGYCAIGKLAYLGAAEGGYSFPAAVCRRFPVLNERIESPLTGVGEIPLAAAIEYLFEHYGWSCARIADWVERDIAPQFGARRGMGWLAGFLKRPACV